MMACGRHQALLTGGLATPQHPRLEDDQSVPWDAVPKSGDHGQGMDRAWQKACVCHCHRWFWEPIPTSQVKPH